MAVVRLLAAVVAASVFASCSTDPETARQEFLRRGIDFLAEGRAAEAIVELRNAIQLDASLGEAHLRLAEALVATGEGPEALREYLRGGDLLPEDDGVQLLVGEVLLAASRFEEARARADTVLGRSPENVSALILRANALAGLRNVDGAVQGLAEALGSGIVTPRMYANLAVLEVARGRLPEAEAAFRQAVEKDPHTVGPRLALANFFIATDRPGDAEATLKEALEISPKDPTANRTLARLYVLTERIAEVERPLRLFAESAEDPNAWFMLVDYYFSVKRGEDAAIILRRLAGDKDTFAAATLRLALMENDRGNGQEVHRFVDVVLKQEPNNPKALLLKARFLLAEGQRDQALAHAKAATAADPRSTQGYFLLGAAHLAKNEQDAAIKAFLEVLRLNPRLVDAQMELARIHLGRGEAATAAQFAADAVGNEPQNGRAHLLLAQALTAQGELGQAEAELKRLVQAFPNQAEIHLQYGRLSMIKQDAAAAARSFARAVALEPASVEALNGMVALDLAAGRAAQARAKVEAHLSKSPDDTKALVLASWVYQTMGDIDKQAKALRRVIDLDPGNVDAYGALGLVYRSQGKLAEALGEFERLAREPRRRVAALTMVGYLHQLQKKDADAQRTYETILEADPNAGVASNNLAWLYANNGGNLDVALQLAQTAKSQLPNRPEVAGTLGVVYYKKGLATLAVRELEQCVGGAPANAICHYHLALAYAKTGEKRRAQQHLDRAVQLQPTLEGAADARKLIASL